MNFIDAILNLAGLLLWLNWRSAGMPEAVQPPGKSLTSTLRRAGGQRDSRWSALLFLIILLFARSFMYLQIGPVAGWTPILDAHALSIPFRSDAGGRIVLYSFLSFGRSLLLAYGCLVLLSILNHKETSQGLAHRLVAWQLGFLHRLPRLVKLFVPFVVTTLLWALLSPLFFRMELLPRPELPSQFWMQAAIIGSASYLIWVPLTVCVLGLHLVESYVYLGQSAFWDFTSTTARHLVQPLRIFPLKVARVDFAVPVMIVLTLVAGHYASSLLDASRWGGVSFPGLAP